MLSIFPDSDYSFPPSLSEFLDGVKTLSMPSAVSRIDLLSDDNSKGETDNLGYSGNESEKTLHSNHKESKLVKLEGAFTQGMKEKKRHEVSFLSALIANMNAYSDRDNRSEEGEREEETKKPTENFRSPSTVVVDVGAGKGWVGQVLAHKFGFEIINLEGNPTHNNEAGQRNVEVNRRLKKQSQREKKLDINGSSSNECQEKNFPEIFSVNAHYFLDFGVDVEKFNATICEAVERLRKEKRGVPEDQGGVEEKIFLPPNGKLCMICLHGCGDLSSSLLYTFSNWKNCDTLVNVGCCYHKLTVSDLKRKQNEKSFRALYCFPEGTTRVETSISNLRENITSQGILTTTVPNSAGAQINVKSESVLVELTKRGDELRLQLAEDEERVVGRDAVGRFEINDDVKLHQAHAQKVFPMSRRICTFLMEKVTPNNCFPYLGNLDCFLQVSNKYSFGFTKLSSGDLAIKANFLYYRCEMFCEENEIQIARKGF
eukprot:TRINITY_DN4128_c0_g1_i7.p1 TRINITY_DN4128_c0_g1~~TRINITY_DN4128_c0_g1_i7.p1  ORF type:complete len:486 (-),score=115.28 TRINITY_DN4128_c0_g1_i7:1012-2469(-)